MTKLSREEGRALLAKPPKRKNKYGAKPTKVDDITFASKAEAAHYERLRRLESLGEIAELELQPRYPLCAGDKGEVIGIYKADFRFWDCRDRRTRVQDVKGKLTRETARSIKHVRAQYGVEVELVRVGK